MTFYILQNNKSIIKIVDLEIVKEKLVIIITNFLICYIRYICIYRSNLFS